VPVQALLRQVERMRADLVPLRPTATGLLARLRADPAAVLTRAGLAPDPWQLALLRSRSPQSLVLCSRQAGKSTAAAGLALWTALTVPDSLTLLLSPTLRQSGELFRDKVKRLYAALGRPLATVQESALTMQLANGSRVLSLPGDEASTRGYSGAALVIVDEASRVPDALYYATRPMLAVSRGRLVCLTTPFGKRGWFHGEWTGPGPWERVKVTADQCPRIGAAFLAEEERALGARWFRQEYECSFEDVIDAVFAHADIAAALATDAQPLFGGA
jgi:hypothetical protein